MDTSERTPLLPGGTSKPLPPSPTINHHHHHHHQPSTSTATSTTNTTTAAITIPAVPIQTPQQQDTEDKVDGVPSSNTSHLAKRSGTPEQALAKVGGGHEGHTSPPRMYGDGDPFRHPHQAADIRVYKKRFWILGCFSFMAFFQCLMWNTWGPLSDSVNAAFPGWGSTTVAMMGNWGTITFVLFVTPMCWVMSARGLRMGVLVCALLIAAGVVLRALPLLFTDNATFFTVMCHICAILVGTSGTLVMAAPPLIAAVWFPPQERTSATAFAQFCNALGNTGSYLEPLVVREPSSSNPSPEEAGEIRDDIKRLMFIWAGVGMAMLVVLFAYFPDKPATPPSLTSHVERLDFRTGLSLMCKNHQLLLVTLAYGVCLGVPSAWNSVLNYSLKELGMSQNEAMYVGLVATSVSGFMALPVGRMTDLVYGHIKLTLLIFLVFNIGFYYWFFLLTYGTIPVSTWQIYVTVVAGLSFNFSTSPLFFELAVECAYPCSEVMVGGIMTATNNLVGLTFLFLFFVHFESYKWVTYVLLATLALSLIPFSFVKENYSRSNIDRSDLPSSYQVI